MAATKTCPNQACGKTLGRSARKCECGQLFGKAGATEPKPKKRGKRRPKTAKIPVATRKAKVAVRDPASFRVGIFSDGGMAIINERGGLELTADQAVELAGFCREQFAEVEA